MKIKEMIFISIWFLFGTSTLVFSKTLLFLPLYSTQNIAENKTYGMILTDLFVVELSEYNDYEVVDRDSINTLLNEMKLNLSGLHKDNDSIKIGKILRAELIISGSYSIMNGSLNISCNLIDVNSSEIIQSSTISSPLSRIDYIPEKCLNRLLKANAQESNADLNYIFSSSAEENLSFVKAVNYYYKGDYNRAISKLIKIVSNEPRNTKARFWIAKSFIELGENKHAIVELQTILRAKSDNRFYNMAKKLLESIENESL